MPTFLVSAQSLQGYRWRRNARYCTQDSSRPHATPKPHIYPSFLPSFFPQTVPLLKIYQADAANRHRRQHTTIAARASLLQPHPSLANVSMWAQRSPPQIPPFSQVAADPRAFSHEAVLEPSPRNSQHSRRDVQHAGTPVGRRHPLSREGWVGLLWGNVGEGGRADRRRRIAEAGSRPPATLFKYLIGFRWNFLSSVETLTLCLGSTTVPPCLNVRLFVLQSLGLHPRYYHTP